ncbi:MULTISPECIES: hypothetical protein [unclassified Polaromonas]|nr:MULTISPECIES: hypothetical protein [unclassified Polaromonas]
MQEPMDGVNEEGTVALEDAGIPAQNMHRTTLTQRSDLFRLSM